jgi:lipopolysaccharide transport system ATP-binding protein
MNRISVQGLGKAYPASSRPWRRLADLVARPGGVPAQARWVLREVSFAVGAGESVGVIGLNGAGKSTLLRILAGTTRASAGSFAMHGRVAALLELGLGVHPEFSGRQNAILACQLMGLSRRAIADCLPELAAFSELGEALEHPVRTYSTGMQLRLAFSIATAVRPDVLLIDEALAVGDLYFQHKSMARLRAFQTAGTTLVVVTHDPAALKAMCQRAVLLEHGRLIRDGAPDAVFNLYNAMIAQRESAAGIEESPAAGGHTMTRSGSRAAEITAVALRDAAGQARAAFRVGETATLAYQVRVHQPMPTPTIGLLIRDRYGRDVFGTNTHLLGLTAGSCAAGTRLRAAFTVALHIAPGAYSISVALHHGRTHIEGHYDWWDHAVMFEVTPGDTPFAGIAALPVDATVQTVAPDLAGTASPEDHG